MKKYIVMSWRKVNGFEQDFETVGYRSNLIGALCLLVSGWYKVRGTDRVLSIMKRVGDPKQAEASMKERMDDSKVRDEWTKQLSGEGKW